VRKKAVDGSEANLPSGVTEWERPLPVEDFWQSPGGTSLLPSREIVHAIIERAVTTGYVLAPAAATAGEALPDETLRRRREVAEWMAVNGQAAVGRMQAVRREDGLCYAERSGRRFVFIVPPTGEGRPPASIRLNVGSLPEGSLVVLLGCEGPLSWSNADDGVHVSLPREGLPCDFAWCLEVCQPEREEGERLTRTVND